MIFALLATTAPLLLLANFAKGAIRDASVNGLRTPEKSGVNMDIIFKLAKMDAVQFIKYYNYPVQTHEVTTEDGYVLTIHHIPHGKQGVREDKEQLVVFLQHGIFSSTNDWLTTGPNKALGFILADAGYDVWFGNSRGNMYSRKHTNLDPDVNSAFWKYSFHEIGVYDLPAMIDYVLEYTKAQKLVYVGHSQGTTASFVLLSEKPEYLSKIHANFALAPVAYISNINGTALKLFTESESLSQIGDFFGINELNYQFPLFRFFTKRLCSLEIFKLLCLRELFGMIGYDYQQFNTTLMPIIFEKFPAGGSLKQLQHFSQIYHSGEFKQYDYGLEKNQKFYNSYFPPKYHVDNISIPIYLINSLNDYLCSPLDVLKFYYDLPNHNRHLYTVPYERWNHWDHLFGTDAKQYEYNFILQNIRNISRDM